MVDLVRPLARLHLPLHPAQVPLLSQPQTFLLQSFITSHVTFRDPRLDPLIRSSWGQLSTCLASSSLFAALNSFCAWAIIVSPRLCNLYVSSFSQYSFLCFIYHSIFFLCFIFRWKFFLSKNLFHLGCSSQSCLFQTRTVSDPVPFLSSAFICSSGRQMLAFV